MFAIVGISLRCTAQDSFRCRAPIDTPRQTDFYRINLSPELVARSKPDLSDVRILGGDGRFVPYVLKEATADTPVYQPVPVPKILQKDSSNRHSYLTLLWPKTYRIDRLSLAIDYPALYKREAWICTQTADGGWSPIDQVSIDPRDTAFHIPVIRTRGLRIDIANADNAPLKVFGISAGQTAIYLLTYLQSGAAYVLLTGDPKAGFPQYDLRYFTDSLTKAPREIGLGPEQETIVIAGGPNSPVVKTKNSSDGSAGFLLWSILSTVLLLLIYFSVKMVNAIGAKRAPHDRE